MDYEPHGKAWPGSAGDLKALRAAANAGDQAALERLHAILDQTPEIWQRVSDLSSLARCQIVAIIAQNDQLAMESIRRRLNELRRNLGWDAALIVERMAIDNVTTLWLQKQLVDRMLIDAEPASRDARFWLRRQVQAERLYRTGLKDLATLQRLTRRRGTAKQAQPRPDRCN